ncbi:hypothetical protein BST61_g2025 [Cercospora zeina]
MSDSMLDKLNQSISATASDPAVPLEQRTFEEAELVLAATLSAQENAQLVSSLSALLPTLQQDPTPAVNLLLRLLDRYSYGDILDLGSIPFKEGLAVGDRMTSYNLLIISILKKAALNAADTASVASMLDTVLALVQLWLCTRHTGVASAAQQLLLDLLRIDREVQSGPDSHVPTGGQGLMWRRLFDDQDIYRVYFEACSYRAPGHVGYGLTKSRRTEAAGRLMEWLAEVAKMDWNVVTRIHHPEIEQEYQSEGGLIGFATLHMVEDDDILLYRNLIDFYSAILAATRPEAAELGSSSPDSASLRHLIASGVHASTIAIYLQTSGRPIDPLEISFLYGPAANYIATYASKYSEHFLASQLVEQVKNRLRVTLDQSPSKWAHAESPKHDLHLLASLPRSALLATSDWQSSPLSLLPSRATNPDVLNTLATIFRGPDREVTFTLGSSSGTAAPSTGSLKEAAEARALYYHYVANNPRLWQDVATHADTVVLKTLALSAINVLSSLSTANWSTTPHIPMPNNIATPNSGHLALVVQPALEYAWPYLLRPSRSFANLVGGRGDPESSAYRVAEAKHDALRSLEIRFKTQVLSIAKEKLEAVLARSNYSIICFAGPDLSVVFMESKGGLDWCSRR